MGAQDKIRHLLTAMDAQGEGRGEQQEEGGKVTASAVVSSIPRSPIAIDISLPLPQMKPHIIELCKDLFKKWSCLNSSCFSIETVSGGITNQLLKVTVREANGNDISLTVRLYGPNTDLVIDREREMKALPHLSAAGFGAELLGLFENGMVQSFINARTLCPLDMSNPKIAAEIARQLRKFHQVEIPGSREPQLWNDIFKFLEKAKILEFDDSEKAAKYETISFKEICDEVNDLKDLADLLKAPVVFSHNDLLSGNLMLNEKEGNSCQRVLYSIPLLRERYPMYAKSHAGEFYLMREMCLVRGPAAMWDPPVMLSDKLYFIDFEYGSYSYRGYDIANHFNEYAGYECDYTLYPDKNVQYHFFVNYLQADAPNKVPDKDLDDLYVETSTFRLASHVYWALWALIQDLNLRSMAKCFTTMLC